MSNLRPTNEWSREVEGLDWPKFPDGIGLYNCVIAQFSCGKIWQGNVIAFGQQDASEHLVERATRIHKIRTADIEARIIDLHDAAKSKIGITGIGLLLETMKERSSLKRELIMAANDIIKEADKTYAAAWIISGKPMPNLSFQAPVLSTEVAPYEVWLKPTTAEHKLIATVFAISADDAIQHVQSQFGGILWKIRDRQGKKFSARETTIESMAMSKSKLTIRQLLEGLLARQEATGGPDAIMAMEALASAEKMAESIVRKLPKTERAIHSIQRRK